MVISKENKKIAMGLLKPQRKLLCLLLLLTAVQAVIFSAVDPLAMKFLIDALSDGKMNSFIILAVLVTIVATLGRLLIYTTSLMAQKIKNNIHQYLTIDMASTLYQQPYSQISEKGRGYFTSRLHDEARQLSGVVDICTAITSSFFICVVGLSVAIWLSWKITLALTVIVPVLYFLAFKFSGKLSLCSERLHETEAQFKSILNKTIDSFKYVKTHKLVNQAQKKIEVGISEPLEAKYKTTKVASIYQSLSSVFLSYAELSVLIAAGIQVILGAITIGSLFALTRAFGMVVAAVQQLSSVVPQIAALNGLLDRYRLFKSENEVQSVLSPISAECNIKLENVEFGYHGKDILSNVSLEVNSQDRILISGGNGVGKSTFLNLLAGFYHPQAGAVQIGEGKEISSALYPFQFLPGTVKDNIDVLSAKWGDPEKASIMIDEFGLTECLNISYDSLSEGQKKKCQIASCLLKPAQIYVLDEPLANIDDASKNHILNLIEKYTQAASVLMIMHEGTSFKNRFTRFVNLKGDGQLTELKY